jgi:hypothetical protein
MDTACFVAAYNIVIGLGFILFRRGFVRERIDRRRAMRESRLVSEHAKGPRLERDGTKRIRKKLNVEPYTSVSLSFLWELLSFSSDGIRSDEITLYRTRA